MYQLENIIRSTTRTDKDRLNILVFCDSEEDYIIQLCKTDHNFYMFTGVYPSQWKRAKEHTPLNLHILQNPSLACNRAYDLIIVFNRMKQWEKAADISKAWHVPLMVVDMTSFQTKIQHPFFTNLNIDKPEVLHNRGGCISIASSEFSASTWTSQNSILSVTIKMPHNDVSRTVTIQDNNKIAIDSDLPQQYINSLPISLDDRIFTQLLSKSCFYLHLWQTITPKMLEAMALGIPVITFKSVDFQDLMQQQAIILIEDINILAKPAIVDELKQFKNNGDIISNAKRIALADHSPDAFVESWTKVFKYSRNLFYIRG